MQHSSAFTGQVDPTFTQNIVNALIGSLSPVGEVRHQAEAFIKLVRFLPN